MHEYFLPQAVQFKDSLVEWVAHDSHCTQVPPQLSQVPSISIPVLDATTLHHQQVLSWYTPRLQRLFER